MLASPLNVDLWVWALDVEPARQARLAEWLSPDESARAGRFATERLRGRWTVARAGMRGVLAAEAGLSPEALRFTYNENGKPSLPDWREGAWFNLSHSNDLAVLAVCEAQVGADIERIGAPHEDVAQRFFSSVEAAAFLATPEAERAAAFYRCWTAKEAFLKAVGTGFTRASDSFTVNYAAGARPQLVEISWLDGAHEDWSFEHFTPAPHFMGAIAVRAAGRELRITTRLWA
jgi:4'-phosphopantetheinyl transferase